MAAGRTAAMPGPAAQRPARNDVIDTDLDGLRSSGYPCSGRRESRISYRSAEHLDLAWYRDGAQSREPTLRQRGRGRVMFPAEEASAERRAGGSCRGPRPGSLLSHTHSSQRQDGSSNPTRWRVPPSRPCRRGAEPDKQHAAARAVPEIGRGGHACNALLAEPEVLVAAGSARVEHTDLLEIEAVQDIAALDGAASPVTVSVPSDDCPSACIEAAAAVLVGTRAAPHPANTPFATRSRRRKCLSPGVLGANALDLEPRTRSVDQGDQNNNSYAKGYGVSD